MGTIAFLFLVSRSDVSYPRYCTCDSNEHVYGMCRNLLWEFNMENIVHIVDKKIQKAKAIFESDLLTSMTTSAFKKYKEIFPDFVASLKA